METKNDDYTSEIDISKIPLEYLNAGYRDLRFPPTNNEPTSTE